MSISKNCWRPSLCDAVIIAILVWTLSMTLMDTGTGLLQDAATGCHIRTGEAILDSRAVPYTDSFSFTRYGEPWFAWEWLSDLFYAVLFRDLGLKGVVLLSALLIAGTAVVAVRHCLWAKADALATLVLFHFWVGASSVHFLARPHLFTTLFMAVSLWLLDRDRAVRTKAVWLLVPLTILWVNLHGGFIALIVSLVVLAAGSVLDGWAVVKRHGVLALACFAASLVNPYGLAEHTHMVRFLSQGWVQELIQEHQPPKFGSPGMIYFEVLLVFGIIVAARLLARKQVAPALLLLAWAHAALLSVRNVPIYAIVCLPLAARELTLLTHAWAKSGHWEAIGKVLSRIGSDHLPGLSRLSAWSAAAIAAIFLLAPANELRFPESKFPISFIEQHRDLISSSRVYTLDSWADYLTYRSYPRQRIFVDGRGDLFGRELSNDYVRILNGQQGWQDVLRRNRIDLVLVPAQSTIAALLTERAEWTLVAADGSTTMFSRRL
jgi:hypothetical protein